MSLLSARGGKNEGYNGPGAGAGWVLGSAGHVCRTAPSEVATLNTYCVLGAPWNASHASSHLILRVAAPGASSIQS